MPGASLKGGARWAAGLALLLALAGAALFAPDPSWLAPRSALRALLQGVSPWMPATAGMVAAGALAGTLLARAGRRLAWGERLAGHRRAGLAVAALSAAAVAAVAGFAFGGRPVHMDGVVQLFQANLLRSGAAAAPAPPIPEFFITLNTAIASGRWVGQFPPGFPALLALAGGAAGRVALHALVAGVLALSVYRAGMALYGRREGLLAAALVAASPFALLLSASGLNHAAAATAAVLALGLALQRGAPGSGRRRALAGAGCGAALGLLVTIRPLDGAVVGAGLVPLALRREAGSRLGGATALAAGLAPPLAFLALYDRAVTGSALELGYTFVWGPAHGLGFHLSPWGDPHTLARGLFHLHRDLWLLNAGGFGDALPLLAAAALPLLMGPPAARVGEAALYGIFLGLLAAYVFYWHHDWFLGPRYLFTAFPFFALLVARGLSLAGRRFATRPLARAAWAGALTAGGLWLLAVDLPARVGQAFALRPEFRVDVAREARAAGIERGLVFVKESWGSRLLAGLLGRGLTPSEAERVYRRADHCALELLLADPEAGRERILAGIAADLRRRPAPEPAPDRNADPTLRLRPGEGLAPDCGEEIAYDLAAPYGVYSPQLATLDPWLSGPLVVARDLRGRNPELLRALAGRPGYLYVPGRRGSSGAFVPLEADREERPPDVVPAPAPAASSSPGTRRFRPIGPGRRT